MEFLLPWMKADLDRWKARPIHPLAAKELVPAPFHDLMEVTLGVEGEGLPEEGGLFSRLSDSILAYRIFGPRIGSPVLGQPRVMLGDTVGLRYRFLPGLELFFASRVVQVFECEECEKGWRSGFVYQTLQGHPELGEEIFELSKHRSGEVVFRMEAWSRPRAWYVKLLTPVARRIQKFAARCAAEYLAAIAAGHQFQGSQSSPRSSLV